MARPAVALEAKLLEILAIGGPRKHNILRAVAGGEERLQRALKRLKEAGKVRAFRRQGGIHYGLTR